MKFLSILFFLIISKNSEAQLRCFNLFESKQSYAQVIDSINSENKNKIFQTELSSFFDSDKRNVNYFEKYKMWRRDSKLSKQLKQLKNAGDWSQYDFDNFTKNLLKLSFLSDSNAMTEMTQSEKIIYLSARQKVLSEGLRKFFFQERTTPISIKRKIFEIIMVPFQDIYMRWTMAPFYMPKLNGPGITMLDAQKLLWDGLENSPEIIQKYSLSTEGKDLLFYLKIFSTPEAKFYFNRASSMYNWGLLTALLVGPSLYFYSTVERLQDDGNRHAAELIAPMLNHSKEIANTDYHQLAAEKDLTNMIENFKLQFGRDPSPHELEFIKKVIQDKNN
jgi:hypothetical protein